MEEVEEGRREARGKRSGRKGRRRKRDEWKQEGKYEGMRLLCSKIHPLCYAGMLRTKSNYALVASLSCSCSKLIN